MKIGCVKEIKKYEYRVGMTPDNAKEYISHGHTVYVETGAGMGASFTDQDYAAAGAQVLDTAAAVWEACDMMIKVKEPLAEEYALMRENQILYTYLHLAADRPLTEALLKTKTHGVAYETIRGRDGGLPLLKPMSEVAGRLSIQQGAKCLEAPQGGMGKLLAGVPGTEAASVVILGGGVVGTNAAKMAMGMGARVTIFDKNFARLSYLDDIFFGRIQTLYSTDTAIEKAVIDADLVIGSVLIPGAKAPKLVKAEYLKKMKPGSVIVDVAIDQGGCCETSKVTYHDNPTFVLDGVVHYCVANMPGAVSRTSTIALTNATLSYGLMIADLGLKAACERDPGLVLGINTYGGQMTIPEVAEEFGLPCADVKTLL